MTASLGSRAKGWVRRSLWLTCLWYLLDDWRARRRLAAGRLTTTSGTRHAAQNLDASLAYVERVHGDYLTYAGRAQFAGRVAEIGPGDNFGVALLTLGDGAEAVHAIDRYRPLRDTDWQTEIYRALADRHDLRNQFDGMPSEATINGLVQHTGVAAETFFRDTDLRFDAILSRAVLEHLYDPLAALGDMARVLNAGGVMVHRIDLRDHGMFAGRHPLTILTLSDRLHAAMTRGAGRPNRVLLPEWRSWLSGSGLSGSLRVTRLAGVEGEIAPAPWDEIDAGLRAQALATVAAIRPKLAARFRAMDDADLAVAGCVLVAEKGN